MGRTYVRSFARIQGESTNINFSLARFDPILTPTLMVLLIEFLYFGYIWVYSQIIHG